MDDGNTVLRLSTELTSEASGDEALVCQAEKEFVRFFHVSVQFFSPVKPWVHELDWVDEYVDERGHLHLKSTYKYYSLMRFLQQVHHDGVSYDLRFYKLVDMELPVAAIDPEWVRVALGSRCGHS